MADPTDFEPATDLPERIDTDDSPVESTARLRDQATQRRRKWVLRAGVVVVAVVLLAVGFPPLRVIVAMALMYAILVIGFAVLGAFARPVPEPPPPGELRRVKLTYRCPTCGAEMRMMLAAEQAPQPPRHCSDEMDLVTPLEDL